MLDLLGDRGDIRTLVLEADDINVVDVLALLPGDVARVAFLLAGLEESAVELLELDLEAVFLGVQVVFREVIVATVDVLLDLKDCSMASSFDTSGPSSSMTLSVSPYATV